MPQRSEHTHHDGPHGKGTGLFVPSERSSRADWIAVLVLTVAVLALVIAVLTTGSASRANHVMVTDQDQPQYVPSTQEPTSLNFEWEAANDTVGAPIVSDGNVFTTSENSLTAWEAGIQNEQWSYSRPQRLCTAGHFSNRVVTVFEGRAGCSDVTSFQDATGDYDSTRNSAFAPAMTLWSTYSHVLAFSPERIEIWRDDLVRTVEYGRVEAPQEKNQQPRQGCTLQSASLASEHFAVTEVCPDNPTARLTISEVVPDDSRTPKEVSSVVTGFDELHLIGLTEADTAVAVARTGDQWTLERFAPGANPRRVADLAGPPQLLPSPATVATDPSTFRWFDGSTTYVFDSRSGNHTWIANNVSGPGLGLGAHLAPNGRQFSPEIVMLPSGAGLTFANARTGEINQTIPWPNFAVDSTSSDSGLIGLAQVGDILYVQHQGVLRAVSMRG